LFWTTCLAEILAIIITNLNPSKGYLNFLAIVHTSSKPEDIRVTAAFLVAWIFALLGALIRRSCYRALGQMFTFEISLRDNHHLVTSGPYSFVRHPSYTSGALALIGALLCETTPGSWTIECSGLFPLSMKGPLVCLCYTLTGVIAFLVIAPRLEKEDEILRNRFGLQWDEWARNVPFKLIPRVY
jgi:protein-S-isoprenylcysteine O-methyltransferase Ste14